MSQKKQPSNESYAVLSSDGQIKKLMGYHRMVYGKITEERKHTRSVWHRLKRFYRNVKIEIRALLDLD